MKKCMFVAAVFFLNSFAAQSSSFPLVPDSSPAYLNTQTAKQWLVDSDHYKFAAMVDVQIDKKRYYIMSRKDWRGIDRTEDGLTYARGDQYFREDQVNTTTVLDPETNNSHFRPILAYVNLIIHEMIHLQDYQEPPYVMSSEEATYARSFEAYGEIMKDHILKNYQLHSELGSSDQAKWRFRVWSYGQLVSSEISSYNEAEYGKMRDFFPLFPHEGCIKTRLTRAELSDYYGLFQTAFSSEGTYTDSFKKFDQLARFRFPADDAPRKCIDKEAPIGRMTGNLPVGFSGPWHRQILFEVSTDPGEYLKVEKVDGTNLTLTATVASEPDSENRIELQSQGSLFSWQNSAEFRPRAGQRKWILVLSENSPGQIDKPFHYRFKRVFWDSDGTRHEGVIPHRQLEPNEQMRFGFYRVAEKISKLTFSGLSRASIELPWGDQEGITFLGKKDDTVRIDAPRIGDRTVVLYQLGDIDPATSLSRRETVLTLFSWYEHAEVRLPRDGKYALIVHRNHRNDGILEMELSIRFSRRWSNPEYVELNLMDSTEHRFLGSHRPAELSIPFALSWNQGSVGWETLNFRPFSVASIQLVRGDRLALPKLPGPIIGATTYLLRSVPQSKSYVKEATYFNWYESATYDVKETGTYFIVVESKDDFSSERAVTLPIVLRRYNFMGPWEMTPVVLQEKELNALGFYPAQIRDFESVALTALHPRGFTGHETPFLGYRLEGQSDYLIRWVQRKEQINFRWILCEWDEAAYSQGLPSLKDVLRTYSWTSQHEFVLKAGKTYALILESDQPRETGLTPFSIMIKGAASAPELLSVRMLTSKELRASGFKLKTGE